MGGAPTNPVPRRGARCARRAGPFRPQIADQGPVAPRTQSAGCPAVNVGCPDPGDRPPAAPVRILTIMSSRNSFSTRSSLTSGGQSYDYFSLTALTKAFPSVERLPFSLKILLENLLRREDEAFVKADDIRALAGWNPAAKNPDKEISFMPARVILQDFTGVPCVVDLAAMRDGIAALGGDPARVNPLQPVELVIDHSV